MRFTGARARKFPYYRAARGALLATDLRKLRDAPSRAKLHVKSNLVDITLTLQITGGPGRRLLGTYYRESSPALPHSRYVKYLTEFQRGISNGAIDIGVSATALRVVVGRTRCRFRASLSFSLHLLSRLPVRPAALSLRLTVLVSEPPSSRRLSFLSFFPSFLPADHGLSPGIVNVRENSKYIRVPRQTYHFTATGVAARSGGGRAGIIATYELFDAAGI